jgi:hypothetical protein
MNSFPTQADNEAWRPAEFSSKLNADNPMTFKRSTAAATAGALLVGIATLSFGQGNAPGFDIKKPVTLRGTITRVEWINPHAWIHIAVKAVNGAMEEWRIEAAPPNVLLRRGLTKESLKTGYEIVVVAYPLKNGLLVANGRDLTLPDGKTISLLSTFTDGKFAFKSKPGSN